jgi:GNAT superfamily N-acetyltransferase
MIKPLDTSSIMISSAYSTYEWQEPNFRAVNKFYKKQKHKGSASGDERVFVIVETARPDLETNDTLEDSIENSIIAAVRLVPGVSHDDSNNNSHTGYYWLRSLYVDKSLRGQNLGSQLLNYLHNHIKQDIHCFPYTHLQHFYEQSNYQLTLPKNAPLPLQQLYARYNRKGDSILLMSHLRQ